MTIGPSSINSNTNYFYANQTVSSADGTAFASSAAQSNAGGALPALSEEAQTDLEKQNQKFREFSKSFNQFSGIKKRK